MPWNQSGCPRCSSGGEAGYSVGPNHRGVVHNRTAFWRIADRVTATQWVQYGPGPRFAVRCDLQRVPRWTALSIRVRIRCRSTSTSCIANVGSTMSTIANMSPLSHCGIPIAFAQVMKITQEHAKVGVELGVLKTSPAPSLTFNHRAGSWLRIRHWRQLRLPR